MARYQNRKLALELFRRSQSDLKVNPTEFIARMKTRATGLSAENLRPQKELREMIEGMRDASENRVEQYISEELCHIRKEVHSNDAITQKKALQKMLHLNMLGYDMSWCWFMVVEAMASPHLPLKVQGYLAAPQAFLPTIEEQQDPSGSAELELVLVALLRRELGGGCESLICLALRTLALMLTPTLASHLLNEVIQLTHSDCGRVRASSVVVLQRALVVWGAALRPGVQHLMAMLANQKGPLIHLPHLVAALTSSVINNPPSFLSLAPTFFTLLQKSANHRMTINLLRIFGALFPLEPRLGKKLAEPLHKIMNGMNTPLSVMYESCQLVALATPDPVWKPLVHSAGSHLQGLIEGKDPTLRVLGLKTLLVLKGNHPSVEIPPSLTAAVFQCLQVSDLMLREAGLAMVVGMTGRVNLQETVRHLLATARGLQQKEEDHHWQQTLLGAVLQLGGHNRYAFVQNPSFWIRTLLYLTQMERIVHQDVLSWQLVDFTLRHVDVRQQAVQGLQGLLLRAVPMLGVRQQVGTTGPVLVLRAAAFILGEFSYLLTNRVKVVEALSHAGVVWLPEEVQEVFFAALLKVILPRTPPPEHDHRVRDSGEERGEGHQETGEVSGTRSGAGTTSTSSTTTSTNIVCSSSRPDDGGAELPHQEAHHLMEHHHPNPVNRHQIHQQHLTNTMQRSGDNRLLEEWQISERLEQPGPLSSQLSGYVTQPQTEELTAMALSRLDPILLRSPLLRARDTTQQVVAVLRLLIRELQGSEGSKKDVCLEQWTNMFHREELGLGSTRHQARVPVPRGLDLQAVVPAKLMMGDEEVREEFDTMMAMEEESAWDICPLCT